MENKVEYPFIISVCMAVYNAEDTLEEAIESIIRQDIGFADSIQLVLVDDGSTDGSGEICEGYARRYPGNVIVLHQENRGVAIARNAALPHATGKYLNFMDSDDKMATDAFRKVHVFFEREYEAVDVVNIPVKYFGVKKGNHWQNFKFKNGTRVVDLAEEYQIPVTTVSCSFLKQERKGDISFDDRLANGEDMKVILQLLYPRMKVGLVADTVYHYRVSERGDSLIQSAAKKKTWYTNVIPCLVNEIISFYEARLGSLPWFVQYTLFADYQWRLGSLEKEPLGDLLTIEEYAAYRKAMSDSLAAFAPEIIDAQRELSEMGKLGFLHLKYGALPTKYEDEDILLCGEENVLWRQSSENVHLRFASFTREALVLEGAVCVPTDCVDEGLRISMVVTTKSGVEEYETERLWNAGILERGGRPVIARIQFRCEIPTPHKKGVEKQIGFSIHYGNSHVAMNHLLFGKFFPLVKQTKAPYCHREGMILRYHSGKLLLEKATACRLLSCELRLLRKGMKKKGARWAVTFGGLRFISRILRPSISKKVWLITDRVNHGDDNGEALFRHMMEHRVRGVKAYFCVAKKSPDFARMKKIGPTIPFGGRRFKLLQLFGATFVSSQADDAVINTLGKFDYFRDLIFDRKFVFLQHGVIQNDLSDWLKKENKNISLFITTTLPEYRSILEDGYGYTEKEVVLTGLPRFDRLYEQDKKVIAVIPTWRKFLVATVRKDTEKEYDESVKDSAYFRFFSGLLCNHRLLDAAEKAGYRICFKLHPSASAIGKKMRGDKRVEIIDMNRPYREIIAESSLLVTDYSSVSFDFAYLKKPVVYCQFDEQDFFSGEHVVNLKRGYFDYRLHGFGEVVTNLEETIELLLSYLEDECRIKEEYRARITHTFRYYDCKHCERVTEKILALTRGR